MAACCSINMRIFKTTELIFLLFFVVSSCIAAPAIIDSPSDSNESNESSETEVHYDQRQNGTENFRVHIDGLAVVVMPVEALLVAGALADGNGSNLFEALGGIGEPSKPAETAGLKPQLEAEPKPKAKPETQPEIIKQKNIHAKSSHKAGLRLMSLLAPFLKQIHAQH